MSIFTYFILFVLIWWILFFICLPFNITISDKIVNGHATSAPKKTYLSYKIIITTSISLIIILFLYNINFNLGAIFR